MTLDAAEEVHFVEHYLLCMRKQLSMECEVMQSRHVPGCPGEHEEGWQEQEVGNTAEESKQGSEREVVKETVLYNPLCLMRFVEEQ